MLAELHISSRSSTFIFLVKIFYVIIKPKNKKQGRIEYTLIPTMCLGPILPVYELLNINLPCKSYDRYLFV